MALICCIVFVLTVFLGDWLNIEALVAFVVMTSIDMNHGGGC